MTDNDEQTWKYSVDDLHEEQDTTEGPGMSESQTGRSFSDSVPSGTGLSLLPFTVLGAFTFVKESAVLAALQGLLGTGGLALAVTKALWVVGASIAGGLGLIAAIGIVAFIIAVGKQSGTHAIISVISIGMLGVLWAGANFIFTELPLLVGAILTFNILVYGGVLVIGGLIILVGLTQL